MNKKRILLVNEASFLNTGFSVFGMEVMKRLYETGKYELAELGSYGSDNDPRVSMLPWKFYGVLPKNEEENKVYNSDIQNQFGKHKFEQACLNFKPDVVCSPPGQMVLTINGYKKIEEIVVGDFVLTHKGRFRRVNATYRNYFEGLMYGVKFHGCKNSLRLTGNHPIQIHKKLRQTNQKKSIRKIYNAVEPTFVPISQIKKGDLICLSPPNNEPSDFEQIIHISSYVSNYIEKDGLICSNPNKNCNPIFKYIVLDENFARLLGYIFGDGHISNSGVGITFNGTEQRFAEDALNLFESYLNLVGCAYPVKDRFAIQVNVNSSLLAEFLKNWCNGNIPKEIWISNESVKRGFISGSVRTDGCYKNNTVSFCSAKRKIANGFRLLCGSIGIPTNIQYRKNKLNNGDIFDVEGYGSSAEELHKVCNKYEFERFQKVYVSKRRARKTHYVNNQILASVEKVFHYDYKGLIYNIEVEEDNSYVLEHANVHNCSIRDWWMDCMWAQSPYRPFYKFIWMPTVDSIPQATEWLQTYSTLDGCASYTDWGADVLRKDGNGNINVIGSFPPGIETEIFKPVQDKEALRRSFGIKNDLFIIGTVMRNQKRKLYPDLIESFSKYLQTCKELGRQDLVDKTYLYIHTSYPDVGWDLCSLIQEYGVGAKTLFTYTCTNCKFVFPSFFLDSQAICPRCKHNTVHMPNVNNGVDRETLAKVMNIFDVYIQYSIGEGFGIPQVEAAGCAVPVMSVNYSAMSDVIRKVNGWSIPVQRYFKEAETGCMRALPDNEAFVQMLYQFFNLAPEERAKMGLASRAGALEHYTYDKTAKKWEDYFDSLDVPNHKETWYSPRRNFTPNLNVPPGLNNAQFVQWCVANIWGLQDKVYTHLTLQLIKNLNYGTWVEGFNKGQPFNRQTVVDYCLSLNQALNHWENLRCSTKEKRDLEYIYG